jgi:hopene-associated glycosyltransferase HpnB
MAFALTIAAAVIWIGLWVAPWRPWSTTERLEAIADPEPAIDLSSITALVPARDEASLIGTTIGALARQGRGLRIVVIDDQSTDGTGDIARMTGGERCEVISGTTVPGGWVGKLWALEQGRGHVDTPLTLLVDADIELRPGIVAALLHRLRTDDRQMVSLMAVLEMRSSWEMLLVPAFVYFFKLLYPFRLSNASGGFVAAAAGGCVLVDSAMLARIGGFGALRGALIDDCALARCIKDAGGRTWIGLTHAVVSRRRMDSLRDIWRMVERSAYAQLRYSVAVLVACVAVLAIAFWVPLAALLDSDPRVRTLGLIALIAMVATYIPTLVFYRRSPFWALALPLTGTLYLLMTVSSAVRHWRGLGSVWKGRQYGVATGRGTGDTSA